MGKKKSGSLIAYILMGIVVIGLIVAIVGMFVGQVVHKYEEIKNLTSTQTVTEYIALFSSFWGTQQKGSGLLSVSYDNPSNAFGIVGFIVTLVGLAVLVGDCVLRVFLKKDLKVLRVIGVALSVVGGILVLVSGLVMANACYGDKKADWNKINVYWEIGPGAILGFVGGLVGGIAGALPLFKPFNK